MDVSLEEKLNQIEISFRNYILILDFLIRETRTELSENRAKREIWQEHHQNWKQSSKVFKNVPFKIKKFLVEQALIGILRIYLTFNFKKA